MNFYIQFLSYKLLSVLVTLFLFTGNDVHRTGAKCVSGGLQDPKGKGDNYHVTGAFR